MKIPICYILTFTGESRGLVGVEVETAALLDLNESVLE